jgi:hypothetical protein
MEVFMKKTAFFWIGMVMFVLFLGTCDAGPQVTTNEGIAEYTDYEYKTIADGVTQMTLYLDGTKVSRTQSSRALDTDLAKMSHDFFEVIFAYNDAGTVKVARTSWEIGQAAGISGVYRTTPMNYTTVAPPATAGSGAAIIMVGRKDKTLLGVGSLTHVNGDPAGAGNLVNSTTNSVTFTVEALKTKLVDKTKPIATRHAVDFLTANGDGSYAAISEANTIGKITPIDGSSAEFPMYTLDKGKPIIKASYAFRGGIITHNAGVLMDDTKTPSAFRRDPRYNDGARTFYAKSSIDAVTTITITNTFGSTFPSTGVINLDFNTSNSVGGLLSFYLEIPVFGLAKPLAANFTGPEATTWWVRTGYGQNLVNLDSGVDGSGCVLIGVDISDLDWIEIFTEWQN